MERVRDFCIDFNKSILYRICFAVFAVSCISAKVVSVGDDTQFVNDEDSLCIPTFIFTSKESKSNFLKKFSGFTPFFETSIGV